MPLYLYMCVCVCVCISAYTYIPVGNSGGVVVTDFDL